MGEFFPHLGKFSQQRGEIPQYNLAHKPATLATQTTLMLSEWKFSVIKLKTLEGYLPQPKLCTDHSCWQPPFTPIQGSLWRSSGIRVRTGSICPLHFGCSQTWRGTWPWCSPLCRWHPTVWPLFTCQFFWVGVSSSSSYWLNSRVDVLEPTLSLNPARHNSLVRSTVLPGEMQIGSSVYFRPWLNFHLWGILASLSTKRHEGPNHQTLPVVLLPASFNTHGSTLTYIISHPNAGPCLHQHASRFLQQSSLWDKYLPPWPSTIGPKFCCMFDSHNWQIWSDLGCNSAWPSQAPGSVMYSIQAQLHHEQLPGGPSTGVLNRAM